MSESLAVYSEFADSANGSGLNALTAAAFLIQEEAVYALIGGGWVEAFAFDWGECLWLDAQGRELAELSLSGFSSKRLDYPKRLFVWDGQGEHLHEEVHFGALDFDAWKEVLHLRTVRVDPEQGRTTRTGFAYLEEGLWRPIERQWPKAHERSAHGAIVVAVAGVSLPKPPPRLTTQPLRFLPEPRTRLSSLSRQSPVPAML